MQDKKLTKKLRFKIFLLIFFNSFLLIFLSLTIPSLKLSNLLTSLITLAIGNFLSLGTGIIIFKWLSFFDRLHEALDHLIHGQYDFRLAASNSRDEFDTLAISLNQLSQDVGKAINSQKTNTDQILSGQRKFEAIIASLIDGIIVLDLHHQVVLINPAAEYLTGYKSDEILGKKLDSLIKLEDKNQQIIAVNDYCSIPVQLDLNTPSPIRVNLTGKGNTKNEIKILAQPIQSTVQTDLGCILILRDLAKEKIFEQMQVDFVSMASHELRTPLTSIVNYLAVVDEEGKNQLSTELYSYVNRALQSAKELSSLIQNFLNVAKIERGSLNINAQPLDWVSLVGQLVNDNKPLAVQKNISLELRLPQQPINQIIADKVHIGEVLNNLISNAINYTPSGGKIEVGIRPENLEVLTYVSDTGVGVPKEAISHLFSKFFRVPGALTRESASKGSGLGLYISKSIIDLHHGKIWVESQPGKGSTFFFTLPLASNPEEPLTIANYSAIT